MLEQDRTGARARDADGKELPAPVHPDLELVREVLHEKRERVVEFMERMACVQRILRVKNANLGRPLDDAEIEEVAQETMIIVWKKLPSFEGRSSLETWVFRIAVFELMNRVRRSTRRRKQQLSESELIAAAGAEDAPSFEDYTFVYEALDSLPAAEHAVVRAKHFDQQSFSEIGRTLGISENTAKTRYYRAMTRLRHQLRDHEEEYA